MQIGLRNFVPILAALVTLIAGTTIAETVAKMPLPQLASMRFGHLSAAEEELFEAAVNGEDADCPDLSGEDRVIRGDLLSWLCTNQVASSYVTSAGLSIFGAEIGGEVDMKFAKVPFPILATECDFDETIAPLRTHLVALSLIRTAIKGMAASSLDVEQTVFLREIQAQEEVNLNHATIGSNLECDASRFVSKTTAQALNLEGANIHGSVFLRHKFEADGGVNMKGATIGGDLSCVDGRFIGSAYGLALDADSAKIVGHVFLSGGFEAEVVVRFTDVQVGRIFQWKGVKSPEKAFLDLRGSKVGTFWNDQKSSPASGHLYMDGCVYDQIDDEAPPNAKSQLGWLGRQPPDRFRSQPYEQLATVLRKMGLDEDARQVMIAKNEEHGRYLQSVAWDWHRPLALTRFFGWLWYGVFGNILIGQPNGRDQTHGADDRADNKRSCTGNRDRPSCRLGLPRYGARTRGKWRQPRQTNRLGV
jgi:hypothetical protein